MKPLALLYNIEENRRKAIELLAACQGIQVRAVAPGEYGRPIGVLCGLEEKTGAAGLWSDFSEEMMVMAFFEEGMMHRFLDAFRNTGIPSIRLKAVLTETNSRWSSCELRSELLREEAAFRAMKKS